MVLLRPIEKYKPNRKSVFPRKDNEGEGEEWRKWKIINKTKRKPNDDTVPMAIMAESSIIMTPTVTKPKPRQMSPIPIFWPSSSIPSRRATVCGASEVLVGSEYRAGCCPVAVGCCDESQRCNCLM